MDPSSTQIPTDNTSAFQWLVIFSGVACFGMAVFVGANDVANSFSTSVGSKAISLKTAVIIAAVFEFIGAFVLGSNVTSTVRSGIVDFHQFEGEEDLLMLGMLASLLSAALWLALATHWSLPVSTTQSIVGSIIGFSIVEKGVDAVMWSNVYEIIIWWFATPIVAALIVMLLFLPIRKFLLRRSKGSYAMTLRWWPFFVFIVIFIMTVFLFEKGIESVDIPWSMAVVILVALMTGMLCALIAYVAFIRTGVIDRMVNRRCKQKLLRSERGQQTAASEMAFKSDDKTYGALHEETDAFEHTVAAATMEDHERRTLSGGIKQKLLHGMNVDILKNLSKKEQNIRQKSEIFDSKCEEAFASLQVLTACFSMLAHGSNDVANAVAPFAAIIGIYETGLVTENVTVDWWVLALGGFGMSVGLATYGYKIIRCLGARMAAMSSSRGYCIELSSALTIVLASYYGQPASTTHAQVGATVGVGVLELANDSAELTIKDVINWKLLLQIFFGWIMTLIVSGLTSGGIFAFVAYSPSARSVCSLQ